MALCNIVGDLGYLGYAFAADGFVSFPKLFGSLFTMLAHIMLLAYGDDQARVIAAEGGKLANFILVLRRFAQRVTTILPSAMQKAVRAKPVGIPFAMLSLNGLGLFSDAVLRYSHHGNSAMLYQMALGLFITIGCSCFAAADFVNNQREADILTKAAPTILSISTLTNIGLALTTWNFFVILSTIAFSLSNVTGFFVRIDKEKGQHLHS
jgi:hypothetical protein